MERLFDAYFSVNGLQFGNTPEAKNFLKKQLKGEEALTPNSVYEEGEVKRIRVVDNGTYEAQVTIAVTAHEGFLHNARDAQERVETYREGMLQEHSPFIDWVKPKEED